MAKKKKSPPREDEDIKVVARNKKARREYEILERFEAGIALLGSEVKSLRDGGGVVLEDSYVRFQGGEAWLLECSIPEFKQATIFNHAPKRPRRLLLHRREILRISLKVRQKGMTVVPLALYFKKSLAKCEIAMVRGRRLYDKREHEREKDARREIRRAQY